MAKIIAGSGGGDFKKLTPAQYPSVCLGLIEMGLFENTYDPSKPATDQLALMFQMVDKEDDGLRKTVKTRRITKTLGENGNLLKLFGPWIGTIKNDTVLSHEDPEWLMKLHYMIRGQYCLVTTSIDTYNDKDFVSVDLVAPMMEGLTYPTPDYTDPFIQYHIDKAKDRNAFNEHWAFAGASHSEMRENDHGGSGRPGDDAPPHNEADAPPPVEEREGGSFNDPDIDV